MQSDFHTDFRGYYGFPNLSDESGNCLSDGQSAGNQEQEFAKKKKKRMTVNSKRINTREI
jgi:hypothetical protein